MKTQNKWLTISVSGNTLHVTKRQSGSILKLAWPAVALSIGGKRIETEKAIDKPLITGRSISQSFAGNGLEFKVTLKLSDGCWFNKRVDIIAKSVLPVPDYVEVDNQLLDDELELCGYRATATLHEKQTHGEEEGIGRMPGCGYPLIGEKYEYRFPASLCVNDKVRPYVEQTYQEPELKAVFGGKEASAHSLKVYFSMKVPYRMRDFELQFRIKTPNPEKAQLQLFNSRYPKAEGSCYAIPVTEIPWNLPGYGEARNQWADVDRGRKFFTARVADGGEAFYRVIFSGINPEEADIEMWAAGYEAPSRDSILIDTAPHAFGQCLPYQFPKGFGRAIKIEIPETDLHG